MQVTVEDVNSVKKILHISVPAEAVAEKMEEAFNTLRKNAKVKGFRPGKAPRSVLERLYRQELRDDVTEAVIKENLPQAILETKLQVVGPPKVTPPALEKDRAYDFDATVETLPPIETIDISGLSLKKTLYRATDEEVDLQMKLLRKNMGSLKPLAEARPAQKDDYILIDYEGAGPDAADPEFGKTENFTLQIGAGKVVKDFEDGVTGMSIGETRTIAVTFPDTYFKKEMAGRSVQFSITLKDIREEVLPELDDAFAKKMGSYESVEALSAHIRKNLQEGYDKRCEQEINEQIYQALLDRTPFECPEILVERELEIMMDEYEQTLSQREMKLEDVGLSREDLAKTYKEAAEKQVRRYIILDKLIEQEKVELPEGELSSAFEDMAKSLNLPKDRVEKYYEASPERLDAFKHTLLQKETLKIVRARSVVTEVMP